jgi:hypothetical protein
MSRTKKKPYTKSKRTDKQCRSHGGCPYCLGNKMYRDKRMIEEARQKLKDLGLL